MKTRNWRSVAARQLVATTGATNVEEAIVRSVSRWRSTALANGQCKGTTSAPYDPTPLAFVLGAFDVRSADLGFDGHVIQEGERVIVEFDNSIASHQRKRFTVAHEVGHLILWNAAGGIRRVAVQRNFRKSEIEELSNKLAAEILAPRSEVLSLWKSSPARIGDNQRTEFISALARHFDISLNFAAVRFKESCLKSAGVGLVNVSRRRFEWAYRIREQDRFLTVLLRILPTRGSNGRDSYFADTPRGIHAIPFEWQQLSSGFCLVVTLA